MLLHVSIISSDDDCLVNKHSAEKNIMQSVNGSEMVGFKMKVNCLDWIISGEIIGKKVMFHQFLSCDSWQVSLSFHRCRFFISVDCYLLAANWAKTNTFVMVTPISCGNRKEVLWETMFPKLFSRFLVTFLWFDESVP